MTMRLACRDLCKTFQGKRVLGNISLEIQPGKVNILLGPNGAGKTTLLRLLNLLEPPDRGEVLIDGLPLAKGSFKKQMEARRRMGFVFQTPMLIDGSVRFNLEYAQKLQRRSVDRGKLEQMLSEVGLANLGEQSARLLSGGEKQRLQLARVMLAEPEVFLLDEPTASLDPLSARAVERIIAMIATRGQTVVWSTHNLLSARRIGQHFIFLGAGRMLQQGGAEAIFSRPESLDIATYAGAENLLDGQLHHHDHGCHFHCAELSLEVVSPLSDGPATALIRPEEILISAQQLHSSARNSFQGTICSCQNMGLVWGVVVESFGVELTVFVTQESVQSMALKAGLSIWLTCKSTSIHIMKSSG